MAERATRTMDAFFDRLLVQRSDHADFFAADLFQRSFGHPFPVAPREGDSAAPSAHWHQYVALWKNDDQSVATVGFCNFIRHDEVYLEGGLCVDTRFYRSLTREHRDACRAAGGIAEIMKRAAERDLDDAVAWFGYCGDPKAWVVDMRTGYVPTEHPYLIVKWFRKVDPAERARLIANISALGPF